MMRNKSIFKFFLILFLTALSSASMNAQDFRVGSFNLRYDNPGDSLDNWKYRKNHVAKLIKFHDFEIFGSQEGLKHQLEDLSARLPGYGYVGVGRDDGKEAGEYAAIFYKTEKFELLESGNFWLSEDTTKPNKGWDAVLPRICSWGKFKERNSGFEFYFYNTHFDHVGEKARQESAKLILKKINEKGGNTPVLLTGDFNVDQHSESYKLLNLSKKLKDSYHLAKLNYGASGTTNGFKVNSTTNSRIDHIFVSEDFNVTKHGILNDIYRTEEEDLKKIAGSGNFPKEISFYQSQARYPSDHFPVLVILNKN